MLILAIESLVLRSAGRTILVDACVGEGKDRPIMTVVLIGRRHGGFVVRYLKMRWKRAAWSYRRISEAHAACIFSGRLSASHPCFRDR